MEVRAENHINSYEIVSYDHIDSIYDEDQSPVTADVRQSVDNVGSGQGNVILIDFIQHCQIMTISQIKLL